MAFIVGLGCAVKIKAQKQWKCAAMEAEDNSSRCEAVGPMHCLKGRTQI